MGESRAGVAKPFREVREKEIGPLQLERAAGNEVKDNHAKVESAILKVGTGGGKVPGVGVVFRQTAAAQWTKGAAPSEGGGVPAKAATAASGRTRSGGGDEVVFRVGGRVVVQDRSEPRRRVRTDRLRRRRSGGYILVCNQGDECAKRIEAGAKGF